MQGVLKKELWKDILITVILIGITFLRFTTFKEINWFYVSYYTISLITAGFGVIYTLYNCKTNKERKWLFVIYSLSLLFFFHKDAFEVLIYILIACIFLENREKFLNVYFVTSVIIICAAITFYFFGLIPAHDGVRGGLLRYSLGFVHPNTIFRYFFGSLMALYLIDKKKTAFNIYAISCSIPLYLLTNSRTGLVSVMLFVVLANLAIVFEKNIKKINLKYAFLLFTIFCFIFVFLFHSNDFFNNALSGRPKVLYEVLANSNWSVLYGNMEYVYCDNRAIYLLVRNGLLSLILVNVFYYFVFKKETSVELKVLLIMSLIYGLTENYRSLGQTIVPLLCMWSLFDNYVKCELDKNDKKAQQLPNNDI